MSEPIPESIPTSADPRSRRPAKKRQLVTPASQQASLLTSLFSKPDQEITLPSSTQLSSGPGYAPPEIVANVQGSSAGAGSGEFHVYKASRRREYERLKGMEEEVRGEVEGEKWEREKAEREKRDEEETRRKREKRAKRKGKGTGGVGKAGTEGGNGVSKPTGTKFKAAGARRDVSGRDDDEEGAREGAGDGKVVEEVGVIIHDDD